MRDASQIKNWVFDLDGTVIDSLSFYVEALTEIFQERGREFDDEVFRAGLTTPVETLLPRYLGETAARDVLSGLQMRFNRDARRIRPFDGMADCLAALKKRGAKIAFWTARERESAEIILENTGLGAMADSWVSGTCVVQGKPHPEGLLRILSEIGGTPAESVMVGDHEHDMIAAKDVGACAVRAAWGPHWGVHSTGRCERADAQFHSVEELFDWSLGRAFRRAETLP